MFEIRVLPSSKLGPDGERLGRITVNDFTEQFACYPTEVPVEEYPDIWKRQLRLLVGGRSAVALVHDPRMAWIIYREDSRCYVQQRLAVDGCFEPIPARRDITEDGERVSEWSVDLKSIVEFLAT